MNNEADCVELLRRLAREHAEAAAHTPSVTEEEAKARDVQAAVEELWRAAGSGDVEALRLALAKVPRDKIDEGNDRVRAR